MNAIVIEQNESEARLAFEVHRNAALRSIRVARAKFASSPSGEAAEAPIRIRFNRKSKQLSGPSSLLRLEIAFRMEGLSEEAGTEPKKAPGRRDPVISVECIYELDYELREGFQITPGHVKSFQDGNAFFNAWPFFREFLQSTLQRMGLPPLTAPFMRLQPKLTPPPNGGESTAVATPERAKRRRAAPKTAPI